MASAATFRTPDWIKDELRRSHLLERASLDKEKRTIKVRFSTETGVDRWGVTEILDHSPSSVRMERIKNGAAVLREHDVDQLIGITQEGSITAGRNGEATLKIAAGEDGDKAMGLIEQDVLRWVSVGYRVHEWNIKDPDSNNPIYRAIDWEPFEISLVAIPADPSARVIRSATGEQRSVKVNFMPEPTTSTAGNTAAEIEAAKLEARTAEKARRAAIEASAAKYRTKVPTAIAKSQEAIDKDWEPKAFDLWIVEEHGRTESAIVSAEPAITARADGFKGIGRQFVELPGVAEALKTFKRNAGQLSVSFELPGDFGPRTLATRATLTTTVSGLTKYERPPVGIVNIEQQQLLVAELFAQGTTESTSIRFMKEDSWTNAAAAVAEEGQFPEMAWDLSEVDAPVRKIGVIGRITDEMLADSQQVANYFEARIPFAVAQRQEDHLLNGTGLNNQITGILNTAGIQTLNALGDGIGAVMKAKTLVGNRVGFYPADAVLMNPADWQSVALTKDGNGQYLLGGPAYSPYGTGGYTNVGRLWGLPIIQTTAMPQGSALVGAFRLGAQLWTRQGMTVEMTNSDGDDFKFGRVAMRAYIRHALTVYRPLAFALITGIPAVA